MDSSGVERRPIVRHVLVDPVQCRLQPPQLDSSELVDRRTLDRVEFGWVGCAVLHGALQKRLSAVAPAPRRYPSPGGAYQASAAHSGSRRDAQPRLASLAVGTVFEWKRFGLGMSSIPCAVEASTPIWLKPVSTSSAFASCSATAGRRCGTPTAPPGSKRK